MESSIDSDEPRGIDQLPGFRPFEKTLANKTSICDSLCMSCLHWHARLAKSGSYGFPFQSSVMHQSTHGTSLCWAYVLDPHLNQRNSNSKKEIYRNEVWNFWDCKWIFPAFLVQFYCRSEEQSLELLGARRIVGNKPQAVSKRLWRTYALINVL